MKHGTLYGIGVGPGDPELITVKGAHILAHCSRIFVPKARTAAESVALAIARRYISKDADVTELVFPMETDQRELSRHWGEAARAVVAVLESGQDAVFLTLGDPLLYSTYIYLLRAVRAHIPAMEIVTVPGITAFSAAAALAGFAVGEGKEPIRIVPAADNLDAVRQSLQSGGTVILMKIGKYLPAVLEMIEEAELMDASVFVSRAGMPEQRVEVNLHNLKNEGAEAGYLSIILVHTGGRKP
jgi:precorrin-2/cobalt-factor-2 C20-methyltransferase